MMMLTSVMCELAWGRETPDFPAGPGRMGKRAFWPNSASSSANGRRRQQKNPKVPAMSYRILLSGPEKQDMKRASLDRK